MCKMLGVRTGTLAAAELPGGEVLEFRFAGQLDTVWGVARLHQMIQPCPINPRRSRTLETHLHRYLGREPQRDPAGPLIDALGPVQHERFATAKLGGNE